MTDEADTTASTPPGASSSGPNPPPLFPPGGPSFTREHLVRPKQGRYVAGVCAALARATNTDPVLWRVLVAVLGILSGVGVLLYLIGWLIIPAEGDSASPIEGLLGKGRSGMAPLSVVLLGAAAVVSFGFIVHDGMRASLLAAAVIIGAVLLIKRNGGGSGSPDSASQPGPAATFPPPPPADPTPATGFPPPAPAGFHQAPASAPTTEPVTGQLPPMPPMPPMPPAPTAGGYRPPFAPHGPWAGSTPPPYQPPHPPRQPRPPKPPRERSKLGRLTFFAVLMVIGLMAVIDMAGASIAVSAYFAAALVTIALGLIVGAWFGRARGLIALAILTSIGLGISTGVERWGGEVGNSVYRPATVAAIADRYDFTAGNATLDLRDIDFAGQQQTVTMTMKVGQMRVLLPPTVDTTVDLSLDTGRGMILGKEFNDHTVGNQTVTDLGSDGAGGGTLKLNLQMDTGNVEVNR
ncbi:PspC domain-containing protein [Paractinoplanes globisporus]|uniref:PspC domain-containing protein n=1 Tax=Paractinoplanes globisporus TaxID=113565 RepID=A0ABW6WEX4_9ACTN|nr:PspC domain-containing protein [Actinoplanes globisporus]